MTNLYDSDGDLPKCLLNLGDETLLDRHLRLLISLGVKKIHFILGYRKDDILKRIETLKANSLPKDVQFSHAFNEKYEEGSLLSMYKARDVMEKYDSLLMDADVLYPGDLLKKLIESPNKNCFLLDPAAVESEEEMRLGGTSGRILTIKRGLPGGYPIIGEGVGFLKLTKKASQKLMVCAKKLIDKNIIGDYEEAIDMFLKDTIVGYELVDRPWMEIDFEEDVIRAKEKVLPEIIKLET
jgi:choline kinase